MGPPEEPFRFRVHELELSRGIHDQQALSEARGDVPQFLLAFPQFFLGLPARLDHAVEGPAQNADFVMGAGLDPYVEVAPFNGLRGFDEFVDRTDDRRGKGRGKTDAGGKNDNDYPDDRLHDFIDVFFDGSLGKAEVRGPGRTPEERNGDIEDRP